MASGYGAGRNTPPAYPLPPVPSPTSSPPQAVVQPCSGRSPVANARSAARSAHGAFAERAIAQSTAENPRKQSSSKGQNKLSGVEWLLQTQPGAVEVPPAATFMRFLPNTNIQCASTLQETPDERVDWLLRALSGANDPSAQVVFAEHKLGADIELDTPNATDSGNASLHQVASVQPSSSIESQSSASSTPAPHTAFHQDRSSDDEARQWRAVAPSTTSRIDSAVMASPKTVAKTKLSDFTNATGELVLNGVVLSLPCETLAVTGLRESPHTNDPIAATPPETGRISALERYRQSQMALRPTRTDETIAAVPAPLSNPQIAKRRKITDKQEGR